MDYSILTGITATTPTLLEGYSEKATDEGWDTFSGEFAFPASAAAACKARLNPGHLVPGYTHCYITESTFRDDGLAMIASVSGMGMIHATTYRVTFSGGLGDQNWRMHTAKATGQTYYSGERGVSMRATEYRIVTTTVPFDLIRTQVTPPLSPALSPTDPSWYSNASAWWLDDIATVTAGSVYLATIGYNYRSSGIPPS